MKLFVVVLLNFYLILNVNSFVVHNFMNDLELVHYFNKIDTNNLPHYELIHIPATNIAMKYMKDMNLNLTILRQSVSMRFKKNSKLLSPFIKIVKNINENDETVEINQRSKHCHYVYIDEDVTAALSNCNNKELVSAITRIN